MGGEKGQVHCIVKRSTGICQQYDERKVYGSVYAACYVARMEHKTCETIAQKVAQHVTRFVRKQKTVKSNQLTRVAALELRKHNKHAAFMYETHRDIS